MSSEYQQLRVAEKIRTVAVAQSLLERHAATVNALLEMALVRLTTPDDRAAVTAIIQTLARESIAVLTEMSAHFVPSNLAKAVLEGEMSAEEAAEVTENHCRSLEMSQTLRHKMAELIESCERARATIEVSSQAAPVEAAPRSGPIARLLARVRLARSTH